MEIVTPTYLVVILKINMCSGRPPTNDKGLERKAARDDKRQVPVMASALSMRSSFVHHVTAWNNTEMVVSFIDLVLITVLKCKVGRVE